MSKNKKHKRKSNSSNSICRIKCIVIISATIICMAVIQFSTREKVIMDMVTEGNIGYFKGEREEEIIILEQKDIGDKERLHFDWYDESAGQEERLSDYLENVGKIVKIEGRFVDASREELSEEKKQQYRDIEVILEEREWLKIPNRYREMKGIEIDDVPVSEHKELLAHEYWENAEWRRKAYMLCPSAAMMQQAARNSGDALVVALKKEKLSEDEYLQFATGCIEGYITLLNYQEAGESKSDICFWIGDAFYQMAYHMTGADAVFIEHCYLMAYCFFFYGLQFLDFGDVDHEDDIRKNLAEISVKLDVTYGYQLNY